MLMQSNRLTSEWTLRSEQAFGATGKAGDEGENWTKKILEDCGYEVKFYPSDKEKQIAGIDIELNNVAIDIKSNLTDKDTFYVETKQSGWLFNPIKKSTVIWHVNPRNGKTYWYLRSDMIEYAKKRRNGFELLKISKPSSLPFIHEVIFNETTKVHMGDLPT